MLPLRQNFHGLGDFFTDIGNNNLPDGGVFYIRGGDAKPDGAGAAYHEP